MLSTRPILTYRNREEWLSIIEIQKNSGKSAKQWCIENKIPSSSFYTACNKLFPREQHFFLDTNSLHRSNFKEIEELKEEFSEQTEIEICFRGICIRIAQDCNEEALFNLLKALRG